MTDSKLDEVKDDRKLKGKTNFVSWKREFERASKAHDIFEYLTGEEVVPPKPKKQDYFGKTIEVETRRRTRAMSAQVQFATPSTEGYDEIYNVQTMASTNDGQWQFEYMEYEKASKKMKLASKLLDAWVCEGIKIEIEDCADAKEAYDFIKKRYAVTNERARDSLLNQLNQLKLEDCTSMTEYTNKVRQIKADLKTVKYDMTDDTLVTALLHGLPPNFCDFKEKYDWIRSTKPDDPPDLDYLYERLHVEEAKQIRMKEEKKDKSHLKCTYPGCGKTGHIEENCWTKDPFDLLTEHVEPNQTEADNYTVKHTKTSEP
jgi:hypothetical protein